MRELQRSVVRLHCRLRANKGAEQCWRSRFNTRIRLCGLENSQAQQGFDQGARLLEEQLRGMIEDLGSPGFSEIPRGAVLNSKINPGLLPRTSRCL